MAGIAKCANQGEPTIHTYEWVRFPGHVISHAVSVLTGLVTGLPHYTRLRLAGLLCD